MIGQVLIDGLLTGALLGLGAIGLTLVYAILGFANFAHGEFATAGAYAALLAGTALGGQQSFEPFSVGPGLLIGLPIAMTVSALVALALDHALFRPLRRQGSGIVLVIASFGASLALRAGLEFSFGPQPRYFSREIAFQVTLAPGLRASWDQLAVLALAASLMLGTHLLLTRTALGRAMRAVRENAPLARLAGIDVSAITGATWVVGAALAAVAGVMLGLTVQVRPTMGFELLLPIFAAAILGGIGSVPGALIGGVLIGLAEAAAVPLVGAEWRAAVGFLVLLLVLLVRPTGLFGRAA